jgi:4-amino-4-deoxy-L-arabinose transferase-like glycosyltransferase
LLVVRLASWPVTWFDEGVFLHGAKNIAQHGQYAVLSAGEFSWFDPYLNGGGPVLLLPIAAWFRVSGIGLVQGRIISVVYALAAIWLYFRVARGLMGVRSALVAVGLLVLAPWGDFLLYGRYAMGEMASLVLILASIVLWHRSLDRASIWWSLGAGIALGLALLTKPQNVVALVALGIVGLADVVYYRRAGLRRWLLPLAVAVLMYLAWQGLQLSILGAGEYVLRLQSGDTVSRALATLYRPSRILANFNNLAKTGYLPWMTPALLYAGFTVIRQRRDGIKEFQLLTLVGVWLAWFVAGSVGWVRYAFVPISLSSLLLADLFGELTHDFHFSRDRLRQALQPGESSGAYLADLAMAMVPLAIMGYGLVIHVDRLFNEGDRNALEMANYLISQAQPDALIETMEWEVDFLARNRFHHPPFEVLEDAVRRDQLGLASAEAPYSPGRASPDYVLEGPMSKATLVYATYIDQRCALAKSIGPYDLYDCRQ